MTPDTRKTRLYGTLVGNQFARPSLPWDEIDTILQDLQRVSAADLDVLEILGSAQAHLADKQGQMSHKAAAYSEAHNVVLGKAGAAGLPREEFYSRCSRLAGFGVAAEVPRNPSIVSPDDYHYRLTTRGLSLLRLLGRASR
jgi:hypothetical protein